MIKKFLASLVKAPERLVWWDESTNLTWELKTEDNKNFMYYLNDKAKQTPVEYLNLNQIAIDKDCLTAEDYVRHLNKIKLGGYSDWRLPTINELRSLHDRVTGSMNPAVSSVSRIAYMSADHDENSTLIFDYKIGSVGRYDINNLLWVRCVRNETPPFLEHLHVVESLMLYHNVAKELNEVLKTKENALQFVYSSEHLSDQHPDLPPIDEEIQLQAVLSFNKLASVMNCFPDTRMYRKFEMNTKLELIQQWGLWRPS